MPADKIEPRDIVTGKQPGGNFMQVMNVTDDKVKCVWTEDNSIKCEEYRAHTLKIKLKHQGGS